MAAPPAIFVGRQELLDRLLTKLDPHDGTVRAEIVTGMLGMGKSALLLQTERLTATSPSRFDAAYVDLGPYGVGGPGDQPTYGAAVQVYELFSGFVTDVLRLLAPEGLAAQEEAKRAHQRRSHELKTLILNVYASSTVGDNSTVSASGLTVNTEDSHRGAMDATYIAESRAWIEEERDLLVKALNGRPGGRPTLLLLDNVDAVVGRDFGAWLRTTLQGLRGAVVVLAQEPAAEALMPGRSPAIAVPPLREEEVRELLMARLFDHPGREQLAPLVHQFSGGVPVAVEVLIDLLNDGEAGMEISELEARLRRLPQDAGARLAEVVATMEDHYDGRPLGVALRAASVPERCDAPLLAELLAVEGVPAAAAPQLLRDLAALSVTAESARDGHSVEVHPFIRRGLMENMRRYRPTQLAGYHQTTADHYFQAITRADSYGTMFDFENRARKETTRQWLRHLACSGDPQESMRQAARIFLDAMWWWGNYVEFEFCETLATDFEERAANLDGIDGDEAFAEFAGAVRSFLQNYPFRARLRQDFEHGYPPAGWDVVQEQVLLMQDLCGVMDMPREPTELENHVKALTETFLAHTFRYASPADPDAALACYDRARECFTKVERWWDVPWITFEAADLAREAGRAEVAREGVAESARQLAEHLETDSPDEELIANLHRLLGDCARDDSDVEAAVRHYGLAVRHAYLFHRIGGPPDDYTMQFYFEIRGRALQWLVGLAERGPDGALAAAMAMSRAAWGRTATALDREAVVTTLEEGRYADLALALFPRGPEVAELGLRSSAFMRELMLFRNRVGASSVNDLVASWSPAAAETGVER